METDQHTGGQTHSQSSTQHNTNSSGQSNSQFNNPFNTADGFDFSTLLGNSGLTELLKHLLAGAGSLAANYYMFIKPMQDKVENMSTRIAEQEKKIHEQDQRIHAQDLRLAELSKELDKLVYIHQQEQITRQHATSGPVGNYGQDASKPARFSL